MRLTPSEAAEFSRQDLLIMKSSNISAITPYERPFRVEAGISCRVV